MFFKFYHTEESLGNVVKLKVLIPRSMVRPEILINSLVRCVDHT